MRGSIEQNHVALGFHAAGVLTDDARALEVLAAVLGEGRASILNQYVRDEKVISLEEAVRKMTSLAARQLHFVDRGEVREGAFADLLLFDLNKIKDSSTFEDPHHLAEGMSYVIVNGKVVLQNGQYTGEKPGKVIVGFGAR